MNKPKQLRVSHYPQVPIKAFIVGVKDLDEALKISDVLASYDYFQYKQNIKPDYSNATVIEMLDEVVDGVSVWVSWSDEKTGIDDIHEYFDYLKENPIQYRS